MEFDEASNAKKVTSCSCPAYAFEFLSCKHMFLLARWDPDYAVENNHKPERVSIPLNPSAPPSSPLPLATSNRSDETSLSSSLHPSSSTASSSNDTPQVSPRDSMKAVMSKIKRTFEQSTIPDDKLLEIVNQLEDVHSKMQQSSILPPNARLPTQHQRKKTRTRK